MGTIETLSVRSVSTENLEICLLDFTQKENRDVGEFIIGTDSYNSQLLCPDYSLCRKLLEWILEEIKQHGSANQALKCHLIINGKSGLKLIFSLTHYMKRALSSVQNTENVFVTNALKNEVLKEYWPCRWSLCVEYGEEENLPCQICKLPQLERLKLRGKLKQLPSWIWRLADLKVLDLQGNRLSDLPETLVQCKNLEEINIQNNNFEYLPTFLTRCVNLKMIRKHDNFLMNGHVKPYIFCWELPHPTPKQSTNPKSLMVRGIESILVNLTSLKDLGELNLPRLVCEEIVDRSHDFIHCDLCGKVYSKQKGYCYTYVAESFFGCSFTPLIGSCCSQQCVQAKVSKLKEEQDVIYTKHDGSLDLIEENAFTYTISTNYYGSCIVTLQSGFPPRPTTRSTNKFAFLNCFR